MYFIRTLFSFKSLCLSHQAVGVLMGMCFMCVCQLSYLPFASLWCKISPICTFSEHSFYYLLTLSIGFFAQVLKHGQVSPNKRKHKVPETTKGSSLESISSLFLFFLLYFFKAIFERPGYTKLAIFSPPTTYCWKQSTLTFITFSKQCFIRSPRSSKSPNKMDTVQSMCKVTFSSIW